MMVCNEHMNITNKAPFSHNPSEWFMHLCTHHSLSLSIFNFKAPPTSTIHALFTYCTVLFALRSAQNEAALYQAAVSGDVAAVRRLIEDHVNVNSRDEVYNRLKECIYCTYPYLTDLIHTAE